jgi:hypothetical protein
MPGSRSDSLHRLLDEAESELSRRLQEACQAEAHGVANESTAEIRRLEDTLLAAALAAERAVAARRHLQDAALDTLARAHADAQGQADAQATAQAQAQAPAGGTGSCPIPEGTVVRQFEDEMGRRWRAWPVVPDTQRTQQSSLRGLGEYQEGWICFEALDDSGRRRLPGRGQQRWSELPAEELPRLLKAAINVPQRKRH